VASEARAIPYIDFAVEFAREHPGHVLHNYGAIQCLEGLLGLLRPGGFILINDYGHVEPAPEADFEHQRFSKATGVGLNFPLLKAYFGEGRGRPDGGAVTPGQHGLEIRPTGTCGSSDHSSVAAHHSALMWLEPEEDAGHIYSRLLGQAPHAEREGYGVGPATAAFFKERFSKGPAEWVQKPFQLARANLQAGRFEAALAAYHEALQRQPYNWLLMNEIALFLTFTLRNAPAGIAMARAALALNPASSAELWNTLGDAFFEFGKVPEAKDAYRRALRISRDDVRARYNLSWVYLVERDYAAALAVIAEALALDETGEYQARLMKKQAEVLGRLAFRNQQKLLLLANRVSKKADSDGVVGGPPVASRKEGPQVQGAGDRVQGAGDRA
jgi:tetratricopeptide (TPR) repeat protein